MYGVADRMTDRSTGALAVIAMLVMLSASPALAHDVSAANARYVESLSGIALGPFVYLGAKHMGTGLDHVAFLVGVVFFLRRFRDVAIYVSLFTLGHSITLMAGVLGGWAVQPRVIDAVIGLSVVYKAAENLGWLERLGGARPDTRIAVLAFGLAHGMGLASKLQDLSMSSDGLLTNLVSFNVGVELGQVLVLAIAVQMLNLWRRTPGFDQQARFANLGLLTIGLVLFGMHAFGVAMGRA